MTRRQFLETSGRLLVGAAAAFAASRLIPARKFLLPDNGAESCPRKGQCRGCGESARCGLPQALSFRDLVADPLSGGKR